MISAAKYLLDSDVLIDVLSNRRASQTVVNRIALDGLAISVVTYGEVYEGIIFGDDMPLNLQRWRDFVAGVDVINVTSDIAEIWAGIRGALSRRGRKLADDDLWIAATALRSSMTLVTRNERHFERVSNLELLVPDL